MAIGIYFGLSGMTAEKYDECIQRLKKAGVQHPAGRTFHASFGTPDKLSVFDVWRSQAAFDRFGKTLMPILHELGVEPGQPSVMEIHRQVTPPAKAKAPSARKRAKAKPAASRRHARPRKRR